MTDRPKIAALVADAFQEEEYFFPKVALNEAGYEVEVVSSHKEPVEIYSYFARTGGSPARGLCGRAHSRRCKKPRFACRRSARNQVRTGRQRPRRSYRLHLPRVDVGGPLEGRCQPADDGVQ
jgi:putative intracellular protease/amidase